MPFHQSRRERDGGLAMRQGLVGAAELQEQLAEVGPGLCEPRVELDGAAEMHQGRFPIPEAHGPRPRD